MNPIYREELLIKLQNMKAAAEHLRRRLTQGTLNDLLTDEIINCALVCMDLLNLEEGKSEHKQ